MRHDGRDFYTRAHELEMQRYADEMRLKQEWWDEHKDDMVFPLPEQEVLDRLAKEFEYDQEAMRELYIMIHPQGEGAEECPSLR